MNILVSGCLLGMNCRYCGTGCLKEDIIKLREKHHLIPVCPEQLGGLKTPRPPAEIVQDQVITEQGENVTQAFQRGAKEVLYLAEMFDVKVAVLKCNSPSCGFGMRYDGTFSGTLIKGNGLTADLLSQHQIKVLNEHNFQDFFSQD